jgi:RNA polymerase sigma-70 factor (sigma-E family)
MRASDEREFREYVDARLPALRRTAYFLCGDWHLAEDVAQTALIRLYGAWRRLEVRDALDGYARRVLVRAVIDERRRPWRRERSAEVLPEHSVGADTSYDDRDVLLRALALLPVQQRAAVVLRYWDDLSVEDTAFALGVGPGTVKSHCARGLARLRELVPELRPLVSGLTDPTLRK